MYREKVVKSNLKRCFPSLSEADRKTILRRFYRHFLDVIRETAWSSILPQSYFRRHITYIGTDAMLDDARAHGGVMMMLGHLGCWEWLADFHHQIEAKGFTQYNVFRRQSNPLANRIIRRIRMKRGGGLIDKDLLLREMVRLRHSTTIPCYGILCDQHPSPRSAQVWTTFLGQETAFPTGTEMLARRFGYPCYYVHITQPKRHYYTIEVKRLTGEGYSGEYPITQEFAHRLEENINEQPEQWLWTHKRWKYTRPQSLS